MFLNKKYMCNSTPEQNTTFYSFCICQHFLPENSFPAIFADAVPASAVLDADADARDRATSNSSNKTPTNSRLEVSFL